MIILNFSWCGEIRNAHDVITIMSIVIISADASINKWKCSSKQPNCIIFANVNELCLFIAGREEEEGKMPMIRDAHR